MKTSQPKFTRASTIQTILWGCTVSAVAILLAIGVPVPAQTSQNNQSGVAPERLELPPTPPKQFTLTVTTPAACNPISFDTQAQFAGGSSYSIAVGDFNRDGNQDLAVANYDHESVSILLGNGMGGFSAPTNFFGIDSNPWRVAVGDFNGDGKQDLAVADLGTFNVSILLGDGSGGFGPTSHFYASGYVYSIAVGDFNRDGKQDLAVANYDLDSVSILLGDGFGGFSAPTTFGAGTHPIAVVVGDFDADGKQDLAVANTDSNNVSILLGNGMGGFSAPRNFRVGIYPFSLVLGDFNGDGNQDLAVGNFGAATVSILLGDGTGRFAGPRDFALPHPPHFLAVGDFNGDGKQDLAVDAPPALSILVGDGMGGFGAAGNFNISNTSFWVVVGDFNNDAMQDLALPDLDSSNVSILMRDCSATPTPTPSPQPGGCVMGDEPYQNNPSLWCVETIMVGCQTYTRDQAIAIMRHHGGGDKTFDVFAETVAAKLNIMCKHSDSSCIAIAVAAADAFLCAHPPGSGVTENSAAWQQFKPTYKQIEKYNDGKSCAPKCHDA